MVVKHKIRLVDTDGFCDRLHVLNFTATASEKGPTSLSLTCMLHFAKLANTKSCKKPEN